MQTSLTCLGGAVLALVSGTAAAGGTVLHFPSGLPNAPVVSDQVLSHMRGGFSLNIGATQLNIAFAIDRVTYINGELKAVTHFSIPSITQAAQTIAQNASGTVSKALSKAVSDAGSVPGNPTVTAGSPTVTTGGATAASGQIPSSAPVTIIQNGPGNTAALPSLPNLSQLQHSLTIIQNTLDNQEITNATVINATVKNLALYKALSLSSKINQAIANGVH